MMRRKTGPQERGVGSGKGNVEEGEKKSGRPSVDENLASVSGVSSYREKAKKRNRSDVGKARQVHGRGGNQ